MDRLHAICKRLRRRKKLSYASKGMFFLVKNFNKQKQEYAMKKDLKCDPCDKISCRSTTLNIHELMKHKMICFQCSRCSPNLSMLTV